MPVLTPLGRRRWLVLGVPVIVAVLVLAGAAWFALLHRPRTRAEAVRLVRAELTQLLDTRRSAIDRWLAESFQDADVIAQYPTTRALLAAAARGPVPPDTHLSDILASAASAEHLDCIHVLDATLRQVAGSHPDPDPALDPVLRRVVTAGTRTVEVIRRSGGDVRVVFAVPVGPDRDGRPTGVIALVEDPSLWLFPFLATSPTPDSSAETFLVRPEGDSVLYMSPLRLGPGTPLTFRMPRGLSDLAANAALDGRVGSGVYQDYRGRPVFAAISRIANTAWALVVKVDQREALAAWRRRMWATAFAEGGLLLLASLLLISSWWGLYKSHQASAARDQAHLATLLDQANDPILFVAADGTIRNANQRAHDFYGYPGTALVGRPVFELRPAHLQQEARGQLAAGLAQGQVVFRTVHCTAAGQEVPVEVSSRRVMDDAEPIMVSVIRDISERQAAELRILRLNRMLRTLSEIDQLMLRGQTAEQVLQEACAIAVAHGGFQLAWIGMPEADGAVRVAAAAGKAGYLDGITVRWDDVPEGRGPAGRSLREGSTTVVADFQADPSFAPWTQRAAAHGLRSAAASPIRSHSGIRGVLLLYADAPGYFDTETVALLEELAGDLSFALRSIEERKALRETEAKLAAFFHSPAIGMLFGTIHGGITDANDEFLRIVGYTREDLAGGRLRWDDITPSEFLPLDAQRIDEAVANGVCTPYEKQYIRKDGSRVWVLVGFALLGEARETSVAYILDISGRRATEAALRETEQRFRLVVEGAPIGIMIQAGGTIRYLNGTACRHFGVAGPDGLLGTPVMDRIHPADRAAVAERITALLVRHEPVRLREEQFLRADGTSFWVEVEAVPLLHEDEPGAMVFFRDITAHKQAMEEQALVSAALEQSAELAVITDVDGTILYVNPAFERVTGWSRAEVIGQNPRILKSGRQDPAFYRRMWETLTAGRVFSATVQNRKKNGDLYVAEVAISPIRNAAGVITRYLGLQRDVTREHELEEQLRQSQKMDAIGRLTGGVAHDFNNLLGVVLANAAILRRDLPPDRGDLVDYADDIMEAATGGAAMVRKLLAFSRRERLTPATVDLGHTLADVGRTLQRFLPETITVTVSSADGVRALLDTGAFDQIMLNLATNARDAMPEGGTLTIRAAEVDAVDDDTGAGDAGWTARYACVEVTDTGHGMDGETLSHVFEPFFTTKPPGAGTGLGLPMVFGLMRQLGGFVRISSSPGAGTTVRLYFRNAAGRRTPVPPPAVPAAPRVERLGAATILVVEDQERLRKATARALGRLGYEVVVAADAAEALVILDRPTPPIDLVLSDLVMPGISGAVLYQRLRAAGRMVPFLLMSGYASGTGEAMQVPEGVALIMKPWSLEALDARIRELLDRPAS